ncbi:hypothetical protein [Ectothiorhodospira sp. PHS-1]|uniref:hypothetical protein n=1 Tax=Ectothiorhodospira sp. PHS-1 TaxID=519989 RepID=UPI001145EFFA|nr:hypothetical protein [Ectothiorhodospira sp. PHS-1]
MIEVQIDGAEPTAALERLAQGTGNSQLVLDEAGELLCTPLGATLSTSRRRTAALGPPQLLTPPAYHCVWRTQEAQSTADVGNDFYWQEKAGVTWPPHARPSRHRRIAEGNDLTAPLPQRPQRFVV